MRIKHRLFLHREVEEDEWALIQKSIWDFCLPDTPQNRTVQDYSISSERLNREAPPDLPLCGSVLPDNETYNPSDDDIQFGTLPQHVPLGEGFISK